MNVQRSGISKTAVLLALVAAGAAGAWWRWGRQWGEPTATPAPAAADDHADEATAEVELTREARDNLGLVVQPLKLTQYWRVLELPGVIVDRPGVSDRGVVAPVTGIVAKINAFPGTSVKPGAPLFTIRLVSESLHAAQLELFKAAKEIELAQREQQRITPLAESGALPGARLIEVQNQIERLRVALEAARQDLQARGLPEERIAAAARGEFATEIVVSAPAAAPGESASSAAAAPQVVDDFTFEVQTLNVELGQQVTAGELLCYLADHRFLQIEGKAFKDDIPQLQQAARNGWLVECEFDDQPSGNWPPAPDKLPIGYLANVVDRESRTFAFYLPLENQWQAYAKDSGSRLLWRFQPGTRVRLRVPVESFSDVFVVPRDAIVREAGEVYVFVKQIGKFRRQSVRLLSEDRKYAVLRPSAELRAGTYVVTQAAAALNRILKSRQGGDSGGHGHDHGHAH